MKNSWYKKTLVFGIIVLFIGSNVVSGFNIRIKNIINTLITGRGNTLYVGGTGEDNYTRIQDAINNTTDGDTVFVYDDSSPYYENVVIDKYIDLIGEKKDTTKIDGSRWGNVVSINADKVTLSNFTIQNSGNDFGRDYDDAGIQINSNMNKIVGNIIVNCICGVYIIPDDEWDLKLAQGNIIAENNIKNNQYGLIVIESKYTKVCDNNIANNNVGIYCQPHYIPTKKGNQCLVFTEYNSIYRNTIANNDYGIYQWFWGGDDIYENKIINNQIGIAMDNLYGYGGYNNIFNNSIMKNDLGIDIYALGGGSDNNHIFQNSIIGNIQGIYISATDGGSSNNQIYQNNISRNREGILIEGHGGGDDNKIYQNNFIDNIFYNVRDRCNNQWDNGTIGNYWDDYRGKDIDDDGIGDSPYNIRPYWKRNKDNYPLIKPVENVTKILSVSQNV